MILDEAKAHGGQGVWHGGQGVWHGGQGVWHQHELSIDMVKGCGVNINSFCHLVMEGT